MSEVLTNPYRFVSDFDTTGLLTYNRCATASGNDPNSSTADASLGSASEIIFSGGITYEESGLPSLENKSIEFDGGSSGTATATIGTSLTQFDALYKIEYDFTVNFWYAKLEAEPDWASVFLNMVVSSPKYGLQWKFDDRAGGKLFEMSDKNNDVNFFGETSFGIPQDTDFHMLTLTGKHDNNIKLYLDYDANDEVLTKLATPAGTGDSDIPMTLGWETGLNQHWAGKLCEFAVFNRQLSDSEVSQLYNSGNGLALV